MKNIVIIPAQNEAESIGKVISDIPKELVQCIIVVNNASTDDTKQVAIDHGAIVVDEFQKGYGRACLAGLRYVDQNFDPDIVIFLDGDYSDYPEEMGHLIHEIENGYDLVLGSRTMTDDGKKGLSATNQMGNRIAGFFLNILFQAKFTDLGPFRAIRYSKLLDLDMVDTNYGWTIEMQIKALRKKLKIKEIPVRYRHRHAGESKVTGTLKGSILAFSKITYMFFIYFFKIK